MSTGKPTPLFPSLLGDAFSSLDARVRHVHAGESRALRGVVTVERGNSVLAKALCSMASLPAAVANSPIEVRIEVSGQTERWTRLVADCPAMRSVLSACGSRLAERFGPVRLEFRLHELQGEIHWLLEGVSLLAIPLPSRWFVVAGHSGARDGCYHFLAEAGLRGIGLIIRYEGSLECQPLSAPQAPSAQLG